MGHGEGNSVSGQIRVCLSSLPKSGLHSPKFRSRMSQHSDV